MTQLATYMGNLPVQKTSQEQIDAITKTGDWLPLLQVTTGSSSFVQQQRVEQGVFILKKDSNNFKKLGKEVEVLVIAFHPRAMDTSVNPPLSFYNINSDGFKRIVAESDVKDSNCFFGPEFLCWIPSENSFALFLCGSKTNRKRAPGVLAIMNKNPDGSDRPADEFGPAAVRLVTDMVQDARKRIWWSFVPHAMSTPLPEPTDKFTNEVQDTLNDFNNPVDSKPLEVAATPGRDR